MTVSDHLDKLEAAGEIERIEHPKDRRSRLVVLTAEGRQRVEEGGPHVQRVARRIDAAPVRRAGAGVTRRGERPPDGGAGGLRGAGGERVRGRRGLASRWRARRPRSQSAADDRLTQRSASPSARPRRDRPRRSRSAAYPNGIAYSHGSLWVGDPEASELLRVDPGDRHHRRAVSTGDGSFLVAASGGDLWVSDHLAGTVSRFEPLDGSLVQTIRVGAFPTSVIDRGSALYAVGGPAATVHRIDCANRPSRDRAPVPGRAREHRVHARIDLAHGVRRPCSPAI